jgi:hypothetical protein
MSNFYRKATNFWKFTNLHFNLNSILWYYVSLNVALVHLLMWYHVRSDVALVDMLLWYHVTSDLAIVDLLVW